MRTLMAVLAMYLVAAGTLPADPVCVNGSFEAGNFTGWTVNIATGWTIFPLPSTSPVPAGTARVLSSLLSQPHAPIEGHDFAALGTLTSGYFDPSLQLTYDITLSQGLSLRRGDTLSGWSFFYNGDAYAQDTAWVRILDGGGGEISRPWFESSGSPPVDPASTEPYTSTPWTLWHWQAPADGNYVLRLGITTFGDNNWASYGVFDNIVVTVVPEPSALALLGFGLAAFVGAGGRATNCSRRATLRRG